MDENTTPETTRVVFRTKDHPQANGRIPDLGEIVYGLLFPLEDGRLLEVQIGQQGWDHVETLRREIALDDFIDQVMRG